MAPDHVGQVTEPEGGHGGQHPSLVNDGLGHHHVEGGKAVRGDQEEPTVAGVVHVPDLSRIERGQVDLDFHGRSFSGRSWDGSGDQGGSG